MQTVDLNLATRTTTGKGHNRRSRAKGVLPAVIYGAGIKPTSVALDPLEIKKLEKAIGHNVFFMLKTGEFSGKTVRIREYQVHPLRHNLTHADFVTVDLEKPITVEVEVVLTGKPLGLAKQGVLTSVNREITIRCLPKDIPEKITCDVTHLDLHMSLHIADVKLPEGVKAVFTDNYTIASLTATREEKVAEVVVAAAVEGAAVAGAVPGAAGAAPVAGAAPAAGAAAAPGAKPGAAPAAGGKPAAGGGPKK